MRLSSYFLPTLKENPAEAEIVSHRLMLRAGMVRQTAAGIYAWLPLGLKVLQKIADIVREEQAKAGAVEVLMPTLQSADLWRQSGRYDSYGKEMLRIKDRHERDLLYGPTNEEMITALFKGDVRSYRDLPKNLFHIQWKFRDEIRPRFGVMRGREFLMKDGYSFDFDVDAARKSYQGMFVAYLRTFARMGLTAIPMKADTGPIGGDMSHEFIILAETGESEVFLDRKIIELGVPSDDISYSDDLTPVIEARTALYAATDEVHEADRFEREVPEDRRVQARGIEVGHIFFFGDKYSTPMGAVVSGPDGKDVPVQMGSYGIGVSRLVGAIIEASHDEAGIIWPEGVAPFKVGLINLKVGDEATDSACETLYEAMQAAGIDTLYDDTSKGAGAKFSNMDLIGVPYQVVVGPRGLKEGMVELKRRADGHKENVALDAIVEKLSHS